MIDEKYYIVAHKNQITEEIEALGPKPADLDGDYLIYSEPTGQVIAADWEPDQTTDAEGNRIATPRGIMVAMAKKLYNPTNRIRISHGDFTRSLNTPEMRLHRGTHQTVEDLQADADAAGITLTGSTLAQKRASGKSKIKTKLQAEP